MGAIGRALAAESRRRWASWLALALLIALVGGTVMAGAVAARRTSTAVPDFVRSYGADVAVFGSGPQSEYTHLAGAPGLVTANLPAYVNPNVRVAGTFVPSSDLTVLGMAGSGLHHAIKLLSGHWPVGPNQVLIGFSLQQLTGAQVGSVIHLPIYAASQAAEVYQSSGTPPSRGPVIALRIVGVSVSMLDFPSNTPSYTLVVGKAFAAKFGHEVLVAHLALYRLRAGASGIARFTYDVNHLPYSATVFSYPFPFDNQVSAIERSITPQVTGWWLFALIAALAGLALVGQALGRQSTVERESFPTLSAIGFTPVQLFWVGMLRGAIVGTLGALGAVAFAYLVSPLTPVGEARAAATASGLYVDGLVLGVGLAAVIVSVTLLSIYPSWRAAQVRQLAPSRDRVRRASAVASAAARCGAPPTVLIGIRHALEAGRGRSRTPVTTALLGTVAAVCALTGTAVFGASLTHLVHTAPLYGQNWNVDVSNLNASQAKAIGSSASKMPGVEQVAYGIGGKVINVNGVSVNLLLVQVVKGAPVVTIATGSFPTKTGELALGQATLTAAHAKVGSDVKMTFIGPNGKAKSGEVLVTGTPVFPPSLGFGGGLGDGALAQLSEADAFLCGTTSPQSPCVQSLTSRIFGTTFTSWGVAIKTAATPAGQRAKRLLEERNSQNLVVITPPTNLVNFGASVNFPLLLGAMAALFGAAALVHLLLVSVARRRRELALLKVLGFLRRQSAATVCWQATTVSLVGLLFGIPLGIAAGRLAWHSFVDNLGAVPFFVVPVEGLVIVGVGVLACALVFAALPALLAARLRPAEALREP